MKRIFKIGKTEDSEILQPVLLMEVGDKHCYYGISNLTDGQLHHATYISAEDDDNGDFLQTIFNEDAELKTSFHRAIISYYTCDNVLVPDDFFLSENTQDYVRTIFDCHLKTVITESVHPWKLYNSYQTVLADQQFLFRRFPNGQFWHSHSVLLKNEMPDNNELVFLVDFRTTNFNVVAINKGQLLLTQIFSYHSAEDVVYQLLKICSLYFLSQKEVKLLLSGLIEKNSAVCKELYQYFLNIEFEEPTKIAGSAFEDHPVHFFSPLFKLAACVS